MDTFYITQPHTNTFSTRIAVFHLIVAPGA